MWDNYRNALNNHGGTTRGDNTFDFIGTGDTFIVCGKLYRETQFGNFIAGYAGTHLQGPGGYSAMRAGGVMHDFASHLEDLREFRFDFDGSVENLRAGRELAKRELKLESDAQLERYRNGTEIPTIFEYERSP